MNEEQYKQNALFMLELTICSIKNEKPAPELLAALDPEQLFKVCQDHILTACVGYALASAGVQIEAYWGFFYRHKWLIPVLWIYRPFHLLVTDRQKLKKEIGVLFRK